MWRARKHIKLKIGKEQYGFMKDAGTRNAIFTLRMICERSIEMQKDIYLCFIDYTKAFDKAKHAQLLDMRQDLDRREGHTTIKKFVLGTNSRYKD